MKHLREYALEYILESKNDDDDVPDEIVQALLKLAKESTLTDYVKQLNDMLNNKDAKSILKNAFGKARKGYKFKGTFVDLPVLNLHPSQSEIDIRNSLGYPFENGTSEAKTNGERYYGNKPVSMPFPLITFGSKKEKNILDGHHRWSQVYAFNKDAKMNCLNIELADDSDIKNIKPTDVLKIVQGFIAAKYAESGKTKLPQSTAKPENNIFTMDEETIKEIVSKYVSEHEKEASILAKCAKLDSPEKFVDLLANNIGDLKKRNEDYIAAAKQIGNSREVMPQTDKGGDGPKGKENAKPDDKGSALNSLINGKASSKVLKDK